jgi:hypothetical protein
MNQHRADEAEIQGDGQLDGLGRANRQPGPKPKAEDQEKEQKRCLHQDAFCIDGFLLSGNPPRPALSD